MEYVKYLMALAALCVLAMPAVSMAEMRYDGKQAPEPMMGDSPCDREGAKPIKSMMGGAEHGFVGAKSIIVNVNL